MKIIRQTARILTPADGMEALRQIEVAGRNCYRSEDKITKDSAIPFVRGQIRRGHLSPLEFADMTVELVTSRDVMAELTRHRLASFAIESQRYVCLKGEIAFIQPECYKPGDTASAIWRMAMIEAEKAYHSLLENGWFPQDARKVLPNSAATRIVMKANLREWRHIFALRTSPAAYPEIRAQMTDLLDQARTVIPVVFDSLGGAE